MKAPSDLTARRARIMDRVNTAIAEIRALARTSPGRLALREGGLYVRAMPATVRVQVDVRKRRRCALRGCGIDITDRPPKTKYCRRAHLLVAYRFAKPPPAPPVPKEERWWE